MKILFFQNNSYPHMTRTVVVKGLELGKNLRMAKAEARSDGYTLLFTHPDTLQLIKKLERFKLKSKSKPVKK